MGWRILKPIIFIGAVLAIVAGIGVAQRFGYLPSAGTSASTGEGATAKRYVCPMMCTPPFDQPGRCPVCGMELVEVAGTRKTDGISVEIEPAARRILGITTETARSEHAIQELRAVGVIAYDESRLATVSADVKGRIEKLYANYVGVPVMEGDDIALLYSRDLYTAQAEFIASLESSQQVGRFQLSGERLRQAAYENLIDLGMTDSQITQLQESKKPESRIRIKSPRTGTVIEKTTVEGDYVTEGQKLFRVADLSTVWLMLELFPDDAASIRFGQQVEATVKSQPGELFTGRVAFINPTVDPRTRTVQIRVEVPNPDRQLRPGDLAEANIKVPVVRGDKIYDPVLANKYISPMHPQIIQDEPGDCPVCGMELVPTSQWGFTSDPEISREVVTIPREAVLIAGDDSIVYVESKRGHFEIRRVTVATMTNNRAVISRGLKNGEKVATHGNFLIDSQMRLTDNASLIDPAKAPIYPAGPLELPATKPQLLAGKAGTEFDSAVAAYLEIQERLAADRVPEEKSVEQLGSALNRLKQTDDVPPYLRQWLSEAHDATPELSSSLEVSRPAFRLISHAMLKAVANVRGPETDRELEHYFCPMVPGGGGDWIQSQGPLANPYWGSEMLRCGNRVAKFSTTDGAASHMSSQVKPEGA